MQRYHRYFGIAAGLFVLALPAIAAEPALMSKLSKAEKDFFFQTYDTQPLKDRVERLEKRVLGSAGTGDVDQRLMQVLQAVSGSSQEPDYQLDNSSSSGSAANNSGSANADSSTESNTMLPSVRQDDNNDQDSALSARQVEINSLMAEGVNLWRNKNLQEAISKFEQVIRLDANNAEAYFSMGVVSESKGEFKKALAYYSRAQELDPKKREYKQASVLINKKLASGDVAELDAESQELLDDANEAFQNKEYLSALDMYKRLETKKPKVASYKYNIGTIYLLIKNPFQALEYYKLALKLKPDDPKYQSAYQRVMAMTKAQGNPNDNVPQQNSPPPNTANKPVLSGWNTLPGGGQNQYQSRPGQQMPQQMPQPMPQPMSQQMPGMQQQFQQNPQQMSQMPQQQFQQMPQQMNQQMNQQMSQQPFNQNQNFNNSMVPGMVNQNANQNRPSQNQLANNQFNQQPFNQQQFNQQPFNQQPFNQQNQQNQQKPPGQNNFVRPPHLGSKLNSPQSGNQKPPQQNQNPPRKGQSGPGSGILFGIGLEARAPFPGAGLEVVTVMNHSRAQKAGILPQDCIMAVEGVTVQSVDEANKILTGKSGDQPISIILKRGNRIGQLSI